MINNSQLAVSIPGFTRQKVEVIPPGFFKGIQLLVNGKPAPRGARRGDYQLTNDKGQTVIVKFRNQAFGLDYPQIMVGGQFLSRSPSQMVLVGFGSSTPPVGYLWRWFGWLYRLDRRLG